MLVWGVCRKARSAVSVTAGSSATAWKGGASVTEDSWNSAPPHGIPRTTPARCPGLAPRRRAIRAATRPAPPISASIIGRTHQLNRVTVVAPKSRATCRRVGPWCGDFVTANADFGDACMERCNDRSQVKACIRLKVMRSAARPRSRVRQAPRPKRLRSPLPNRLGWSGSVGSSRHDPAIPMPQDRSGEAARLGERVAHLAAGFRCMARRSDLVHGRSRPCRASTRRDAELVVHRVADRHRHRSYRILLPNIPRKRLLRRGL